MSIHSTLGLTMSGKPFTISSAVLVLAALLLAPFTYGDTDEEGANASELELPPREEIERHKTYDRGPELQRTPGGDLIVNAFIMDGPVRVEIRDRHSGELVMQKQEQSLFPFEVPRRELGTEPTQVLVRIFVKGEQVHELDLLPER